MTSVPHDDDQPPRSRNAGLGDPRTYYFEDFRPGQQFTTVGRTLFESDVMGFVGLAGIHEELYTNLNYITHQSLFGQPFAPGPLTFALAEGLVIQTGIFRGSGLALLESHLRFAAPLLVGETFRVEVHVDSTRATHHFDRGVVGFAHRVLTAADKLVLTVDKTRMVRRRPTSVAYADTAGVVS